MDVWYYLGSLAIWTILYKIVEGSISCECTTLDCQAERRRTCEAKFFCYVENMNSVVTRGCINDKTPLLCENRKPSKLASGDYPEWPFLFCCKDGDFCNRDVVPIKPTDKPVAEPDVYDQSLDKDEGDNNPYVRYEYDQERAPCPNSNDNSKLNPIYIAVPIAGVCVLLALIIFAMYLLRRRTDMYAQYDAYHYHEQMAKLANKQNENKVQGCETNRCTDSERSSQGSETKLFLNA